MLPDYVTQYLELVGVGSTTESIVVASSDDTGLFVFQRYSHDTQVLAGTAADLAAFDTDQNASKN